MTKALRSFDKKEREFIAIRRKNSGTRGLGYWGAVDYLRQSGKYIEIDYKKPEQPKTFDEK